jgi:hypothetical protein
MSSSASEEARRSLAAKALVIEQMNEDSLYGNGRMHDVHGVYNPYWDCEPRGHDDDVQWETERPLRHTSSRAPAPDWQRSVASLWDEVSRFQGLEEALCTPGEERFVVFTQRECTVEDHAAHPSWFGEVKKL